jgi:cell division protein ZapA
MNNKTIKPIEVTILGKPFRVACPENQEYALYEAAEYLDRKMRALHETGRIIGLERIAVVAALNITNELLAERSITEDHSDLASEKVTNMQKKIDAALQIVEHNS